MDKKIKEDRDKKINQFILNCLKKRPLSSSQILEKIQKQKDSEGKPKFKVNTPIGLRKDHLKYLEKTHQIFRLDKKDNLSYGKIADKKTYKISAEDFLEEFWSDYLNEEGEDGEWGKGGERNYYHAYYFATPKTAKWRKILEEAIIENIVKRFSSYLKQKEEIEAHIKKLFEIFPYLELFPRIKLKNYKSISKKEFDEYKSKPFGFDIIEKDFNIHSGTSEVHISYFMNLQGYLESLHIKLIKEKIMIEDVLKDEFENQIQKDLRN